MNMPVPANQPQWQPFNLQEELIENPVTTFFVRVSGDSMIGSGIYSNDILIVDKAIEARNNHVIVAVLNGEFTVKRLKVTGETIVLMPANPKYQPIEITETMDFYIWGVVTHLIHRFTPGDC